MKHSPVIALLIAYGPETRALLQSGLAERLASRSRTLLVTSRPQSPALKVWGGHVLQMPEAPESLGMQRVRGLSKRLRLGLRGPVVSGVACTERLVSSVLGGSSAWTVFLRRNGIDALIAASYSSARTLPALQSARNLSLPTIVLLNSFKDVYKQPYAAATPSALSVFGEREVELFRGKNPGYRGELRAGGSLHLAAALSRRGEISRNDLCRRLRLDPRRPIVTYCAAAPGSSVDEVNWVRKIAREAPTWRGRPQLLIRGNPMDETRRFEGVRASIWHPSWEWRRERDWCCPAPHDTPLWAAALEQSAMCISAPSTVTTEFLAFGKPVVNLCGPSAWQRLWQDEFYAEARETGWATGTFDMAGLRDAAERALSGEVTAPRPDFASVDPVRIASDLIERTLQLPPARRDPIPLTA